MEYRFIVIRKENFWLVIIVLQNITWETETAANFVLQRPVQRLPCLKIHPHLPTLKKLHIVLAIETHGDRGNSEISYIVGKSEEGI